MANWTRSASLMVVLVICVTGSLQAEIPTFYASVGGTLTLVPTPPISVKVTRIVWKRSDQLVAEYRNTKFTYYGSYKDRTKLTEDGRLEISDAMLNDSASYTLEVNNQIGPAYNAEVIKEVPKPTVRVTPLACSSDSLSCTLICEGDTQDAGPVNTSWWFDEELIKGDVEFVIERETFKFKKISCQMMNRVSEKKSDPTDNPFIIKPFDPTGLIVFLIVAGIAAGLGGLAVAKKDVIKDWVDRIRNTGDGGNGNQPVEVEPLKRPTTGQNETGSSDGHGDGKTGSPAPPADHGDGTTGSPA